MAFTDHKITQFEHRIADLADQPNLPPDELKARFDSSPEELRQAVNAICDDADRLDARVSGIIAETFSDTIPKSMLSDELQDELDAKAVETSVAERFSSEQTAREAADTALQSSISSVQSSVAAKCEVYIGTYAGNGAAQQEISLGFHPIAVMVTNSSGIFNTTAGTYGGVAIAGQTQNAFAITENGFIVYEPGGYSSIHANANNETYRYMAFKTTIE